MIIAGIILIVVGAATIIYGVSLNNSVEAQLEALLGSGTTDPGTIWIIIGAVAAVIGVILLITGMTKKSGGSGAVSAPRTVKEKITCPKCGVALEADAVFCVHCGAPLKDWHKLEPEPALTVHCPSCMETLGADAVFCTYCGTSLKGSTTHKSVPVTADVPKKTVKTKADRPAVCSHCGARQAADVMNCKYCGTAMR